MSIPKAVVFLFFALLYQYSGISTDSPFEYSLFVFLPAIILGYNAVIIGITCAFFYGNGNQGILLGSGAAAHGIFEIPALILSAALGIYLCGTG